MNSDDFETRMQENIRALLAKNQLADDVPAFAIAAQIIRDGFGSLSWTRT